MIPRQSITEIRADLPQFVIERILGRCLAKESAERYVSARELREALERLRREISSGANSKVAGTGGGPSIAVLPFSNMSADPENEFFADGITEEIINALTQIEGVARRRAVPRRSRSRTSMSIYELWASG